MLLKLQSFNPSWFSATSASNSGPEKPSPAFPFKSSTFCFLLNLSGFSANSRRTAVPRSQEITEPGGVEGGKGHCSLFRYLLNCGGQASLSTALRGTLSSIVSSLGNSEGVKDFNAQIIQHKAECGCKPDLLVLQPDYQPPKLDLITHIAPLQH